MADSHYPTPGDLLTCSIDQITVNVWKDPWGENWTRVGSFGTHDVAIVLGSTLLGKNGRTYVLVLAPGKVVGYVALFRLRSFAQ